MATKVKKGFVVPITENQVCYTTVKRLNLRDKTKAPLYYAQVHHMGRASLETIQRRVEQMSALSKGDVQSVLINMVDVVIDELRNGRIVELGELGKLYIGVNSKGVPVEKDFSAAQIKSGHINFRAGKEMDKTLKSLSFVKLGDVVAATASDGNSGGKSGTDTGNTKTDDNTDDTSRDGGNV